jgi:hypothetical protein
MPIEFPIVALLSNQSSYAGYVAICEFHINLKRISPDFIATLVACTFS